MLYFCTSANGRSILELPKNLLQMSNSFVYSLFNNGILFQVVPPENQTEIDLVIDTMVVGFTLYNKESPQEISKLRNPVIIKFQGQRVKNNMVSFSYLKIIM